MDKVTPSQRITELERLVAELTGKVDYLVQRDQDRDFVIDTITQAMARAGAATRYTPRSVSPHRHLHLARDAAD